MTRLILILQKDARPSRFLEQHIKDEDDAEKVEEAVRALRDFILKKLEALK